MSIANFPGFFGGNGFDQAKASNRFMFLLIEAPGGEGMSSCVAVPVPTTNGSEEPAAFVSTLPGGYKVEGIPFQAPEWFARKLRIDNRFDHLEDSLD